MLPLHTSGIVACTYHLFYNAPAVSPSLPTSPHLSPYLPISPAGARHRVVRHAAGGDTASPHISPYLPPSPLISPYLLQAAMTCVGNTTLALACLRLALASGWTWQAGADEAAAAWAALLSARGEAASPSEDGAASAPASDESAASSAAAAAAAASAAASASAAPPPSQVAALVGWEDLGEAWAADGNAAFLAKLLALSGGLAYAAKYLPALVAGVQVSDELLGAAAGAVIVVPTALNCAKWLQRSKEGAEFVGDI